MTQSRAIVTIAAMFLAFASVVVVLWLGANDVVGGRMTGGELSQFLLYAVLGAGALGQLSEVWNEVSQAAGAAARIGELIAVEPRIVAPSAPTPPALAGARRDRLRQRRLRLSRPAGRAGAAQLEFARRAGRSGGDRRPVRRRQVDAVPVASSASTTRPKARSCIDGVDIAKADPQAVRREIALVPQEPFIFGASVADNIAYGAPGATREAIVEAAKQAAADGFISALPQGYETPLGERGVTLSGGERQRLAIARAILRNAPILLLDEATSALDAENETLVQGALEALMKGRTTLVIAHRLATIVNAQRILVIDGGGIVEEGTHASLLAAGGLYARLARLQFETGAAALTGEVKAAE